MAEKRYRARMITFEQWRDGYEDSWYQEWLESPEMKTIFRSARFILRTTDLDNYKRHPDRSAFKASFWDITDEDKPVHLYDLQKANPHSSKLIVIIDHRVYELANIYPWLK